MKFKTSNLFLLLFPFLVFAGCQHRTLGSLSKSNFLVQGRTEMFSEGIYGLISPASSITFSFQGTTTTFKLKSDDSWEHHNYFCLVVDGVYKGRFKIEKGPAQTFTVSATDDKVHTVTLYKATEAASGTIVFDGSVINGLVPTSAKGVKKIEFIGDSITCGAQSDPSETPCNQGEYFDQHNAYFAYGPVLSRKLNVDFTLSSVSGIGMYRNWNDENIVEPIMPQVYENLYLNSNADKVFEASNQPDLVSICLGTNDMSNGDGQKTRLPFDKDKYTANYINFIKTIFKRYPKTKIVLLNSPMLSKEQNAVLIGCLKNVIKAFDNDKVHKPIALFEYNGRKANGCTGHPNIADHQVMAEELESLFTQLLNEK